jgi:hypothetical protein
MAHDLLSGVHQRNSSLAVAMPPPKKQKTAIQEPTDS